MNWLMYWLERVSSQQHWVQTIRSYRCMICTIWFCLALHAPALTFSLVISMQCRGLVHQCFQIYWLSCLFTIPGFFFQSFAVGSKFRVHKLGRCSGCFSDKNKTFWPNLSVRLVEKTEQKLFETFNEQVFSEIVVPNLLWVVLRKPKNVRMGHLCGRVCEWTMKIRTRCDVTKNHHSQIELICNNSGVWCLAFVCVLGSRQSSVSTAL